MHPIDKMLKLSLEGEHDAAWEISEAIEKAGPENLLDLEGKNTQEIWLRHCFNRGWHLVQQGVFNEGFKLLESGRFLNTYGGGVLKTAAPIFNPVEHKSAGKSIILSLEGGYGDEIIHARFATHLKKIYNFEYVHLACEPTMGALFSRIEGVDEIITRAEANKVKHDYWLPGFSAGWICGFEHDTLPGNSYLTVNPLSADIWKKLIKSDKPKVGIRWAGNPKFEHQQFRIFPADFLIKMAEAFPDVQFYSFQRDGNIEELPPNIIDLQNFIISWEDTAAAIGEMDLMISSCTSVAHLSAALGKETWVITPILPYHTWAYGSPGKPGDRGSKTSPWYDTVKVYRQIYKGKWQPTFDEIYLDFEERFGKKRSVEIPSCEEVMKKLNLGCGFKKLDGFLNVDNSDICKPDLKFDMEQLPWPFKDNEFNHIVGKDIMEHMHDLPSVVKEMYRISKNGAVWEIQVPHPRCDLYLDDPTHVRPITETTFKLFDQKRAYEFIQIGRSDSYLSFELGVDISVLEVKYEWVDYWLEKVRKKEITEEELYTAANTMNNVISSIIMLIQVHKPGRIELSELHRAIENKS